MPKRTADLNVMIRAAEKASRSLLRDFGEVDQLQVSKKGPADFVSAADKRAEKIIFEELKDARPRYSFLMEESGRVDGEDTESVFIIDPLDGTMNFLNGIPFWCISIALERAGEVVAAVVYDPCMDEMFVCDRGDGAFVSGRKRLRVSSKAKMEAAVVVGGEYAHVENDKESFMVRLEKLKAENIVYRNFGAMALELAYVAAGRIDAFWQRRYSPWDAAAGMLLVREAGGTVTSLSKKNDNPVYSEAIIATNSVLHKKFESFVSVK